METLKNIASLFYFFLIFSSIIIGSITEYFGNPYGKYIMLPGIILGVYEIYKSDK